MRELMAWGAGLLPELATALACVLVVTLGLVLARSTTRPLGEAVERSTRDALVLAALALVAVATLTPVPGVDAAEGWRLSPFQDLLRARSRWALNLATANLLANAALFAPLGLALAARFARTPALLLVGVAVLVSLAVETVQGSTLGRSSDITDVIMNTLGAAAAVALWRTAITPGARLEAG